MIEYFAKTIASELSLSISQVKTVLKLYADGATIPFVARYRKEQTGSLDEVQLAAIRDLHQSLEQLEERRQAIISRLEKMEVLTEILHEKLLKAETLQQLEDLYLPFKTTRRTRSAIAKEKGLESLAKMIMAQHKEPLHVAKFVNSKKGVNSEEEALLGAQDIIAEWVNESLLARDRMRRLFQKEAQIVSKVVTAKKAEAEKYTNWFDWSERAAAIPSHRALAIFRAEKEGFLRVRISPEKEAALSLLESVFLKGDSPSSQLIKAAISSGYSRLLQPALESEFRAKIKLASDKKAITVFADNLRQLLMASPVRGKRVLALDPGFRSGCKLVCLDKNGKLLHNETIFPHAPQHETKLAAKKILSLIDAYKIDAIAIGNGTAGRETEDFIRKIRFDRDLVAIMVNENGASIYSASTIARQEFPEYDVTVRGAVSIGRRMQDPLAELVKIDPKAIGVGQYQHDVNQRELQQGLSDVVEQCVNGVGANVNSASAPLLTYISGIGASLAANIVAFRDKNGPFQSRSELKKVSRFGEKAFEQAAGFLRIPDAEDPLDNSAVHPESYSVVKRIATALSVEISELIGDSTLKSRVKLEDFVTDRVGIPTLTDILKELEKPGRDPRRRFVNFEFDRSIRSIEDLKPGMVLPGVVNNITAFGAFVDVGIKQSGLVHLSQLADRFISDPKEVVSLNQQVQVRVVDVDISRKRIQLSMKDLEK